MGAGQQDVYGFPSLFRIQQLSEEQVEEQDPATAPPFETWRENEAQFDAGGFTEEFKAYYKFMMDHYTRDDGLPHVLSIIEHGITWLLAILPEELRPSYRDRYYKLVDTFAKTDETRKMVSDWLDRISTPAKTG